MFYERDKNAAHKDSDYIINSDISVSELIIKMKDAISTTKVVCSNVISNKIEYEYYAYDSLLFRYVNGITPDLEKGFNDSICIKQQCTDKNSIVFKAISDVRQVRNLKPNGDYCVICTNGLIGQPYDMLEHRQDMCFKLNTWQQNCDVWVTIKNDEVEEMLQAFFNEDLYSSFDKFLQDKYRMEGYMLALLSDKNLYKEYLEDLEKLKTENGSKPQKGDQSWTLSRETY